MAARRGATAQARESAKGDGLVKGDGLLSVDEAAKQAGVTRFTVRNWIRSGLLPSARIEGRRRIRADDLAATQAVAHVGKVVPAWRRNPRRSGQRLRAVREAAGLSQLALERTSGLRHETISRFELGQQVPQARSVRQLADALGVEPEVFIARKKIAVPGMTTAEAAARLEVPEGRVQVWLRRGKLAGVKVSGQWRVPLSAVLELERSERLRGRSRRLDPRYRG